MAASLCFCFYWPQCAFFWPFSTESFFCFCFVPNETESKAKRRNISLASTQSIFIILCSEAFRAAFRWLLTTKKFSANINHNCRQLEIHKQLSRQLLSGKSDLFCIFFAFFFFRQPSQKGHEKVSFIRSHENAFNQQINIRTTVARLVSRIIFIFILL